MIPRLQLTVVHENDLINKKRELEQRGFLIVGHFGRGRSVSVTYMKNENIHNYPFQFPIQVPFEGNDSGDES